MCTALLRIDLDAPLAFLLAANRDEFTDRPWAQPTLLRPGVFGGQDLRAQGTWFCVGREAAALLTNIPSLPMAPGAPTRGELPIQAVLGRLPDRFPGYNPFNLLVLDAQGARVVTHRGGDGAPQIHPLRPGDHVIGNQPFGDPPDGRALAGAELLRRSGPGFESLSHHGTAEIRTPLCIHGERYATGSATMVGFDREMRLVTYLHRPGQPCTTETMDCTALAKAALVGR